MNLPPRSSLPGSPAPTRIARLRNLSYWLDSAIAIPGTRLRFGLDPIIGLLPGGGDTAGLLLSAYIVLEAARMGASKSMLSRMAFNILLETVAGTLPIAGDLFDAAWKSNVRNMRLLEEHLQLPPVARARNRWFAVLLIIGLILVFIGCVFLSLLLLRWIIQQFGR
ncbi:MAG: DUF4112 domain-containing protein [Cyanobacteria bacterium Co-bin13]|nr:DUF4112 domain-containing protein [Cyanobacteria bacterium Co-bin13]